MDWTNYAKKNQRFKNLHAVKNALFILCLGRPQPNSEIHDPLVRANVALS